MLARGGGVGRVDAYEKTFWYISGQLETLPQSIRKWTRSHESSPNIHGLSKSRGMRNRRFGGILRALQVSE